MKFDLASGFGKLHSQKENHRPHLKKKKIMVTILLTNKQLLKHI